MTGEELIENTTISGDAVVSAGDAVVSAGDAVVSAGDAVVSAGDAVVSAGDAVVSAGDAVVSTGDPVVSADGPAAETSVEEPVPLADLKGDWYVLHVFTGYEKKVCTALEQRIKEYHLADRVHKVLVPEEDVIEVKNNKRVEKRRKMFPGYVFVNMEKDDEAWYQIRRINGVSKFVGAGFPEPLPEKDVMRILSQTGEKVKKIEIDFEVNESVKVISGPFRGYVGEIKEILPERGKVKVMISIFGRSTPMELDFNQIEKNA